MVWEKSLLQPFVWLNENECGGMHDQVHRVCICSQCIHKSHGKNALIENKLARTNAMNKTSVNIRFSVASVARDA